jgi:hypothetical protein
MSTFLIQRQEPIQKIREEIYRRSVMRMGGFSESAKLSILLWATNRISYQMLQDKAKAINHSSGGSIMPILYRTMILLENFAYANSNNFVVEPEFVTFADFGHSPSNDF